MGANMASCLLEVGRNVESLELLDGGHWIRVNGTRLIPRELVLHADPFAFVEAEIEDEIAQCDKCGKTFPSGPALGGHKRHCRGAVAE